MYHNHNLRNHLDNLQKHGDTSSDAELAHTDSHVLQMTKKCACFSGQQFQLIYINLSVSSGDFSPKRKV